ncbi:MAG: site-2 protease family protein [Fimbriimonadales bacterium]
MKWSLKVARVAGINVYVHATFLILLIWIAAGQYLSHETTSAMLGMIGFVLLLFAIIVLHELGHALAARRYGIETQDITLLPIGGVARLNKIPEDPKQELVVAFAGPLVNLVIAAGLFIGLAVSSGLSSVLHASLEGGNLIASLLVLNVWLAFFNLLPAFPMDGGRVFRALLGLKLSRVRATEIAVGVGHAMALIFGAVGLFGLFGYYNPFLVFIALFIWVGADGELQQVRMHAYLHGIPVSEVMARQFDSLPAVTPLEDLARAIVPGFQRDFPVYGGDRLIGFIGVDDVVRGLSEGGSQALVEAYMQKDFVTADPDDSLEQVMSALRPGTAQVVAVMKDGSLVGIVTPANIGEHMMVRSAMARSAKQGQL